METKQSYVGCVISDIHAGAVNAETLYNELNKSFLKYIKSLKILDFIVIAGDLFDNKLSLNSEHTKYIFIFLRKLLDICEEKNTKLRIIKGTEFHDNKQLDILRFLYNSNVDIRIYETVSDEELFPGFNVLYIPEEYMQDKDEYYKPYFEKSYDMIFGHGLINEVAFTAKMQSSEVTMNKAPIFKSETLLDIARGPIFFGHIHRAQTIKDRIYYTGSFTRWVYGEEQPKGFMLVCYTPDSGKYEVEFVENKLAPLYNTMVVDYNSSFYRTDEHQQVEYILSMVKNMNVDRMRIIFNIPTDYPNPILLTNLINDVFSRHRNIKIVINNNSKEQQKKREFEEKIKTLLTTYDFIFDKSISPEEKISKFIKLKYNKNISIDSMRNYLYQKINI